MKNLQKTLMFLVLALLFAGSVRAQEAEAVPESVEMAVYMNYGYNYYSYLCSYPANVTDTSLFYVEAFNPAETEGNRYENAKTYYIAPLNVADKKLWNHPTIKPLDFTEKIIRNSSKKGETVLDPFMGSGTTGVACKNLERNFIGIELSKEYFEIAKKRIETC